MFFCCFWGCPALQAGRAVSQLAVRSALRRRSLLGLALRASAAHPSAGSLRSPLNAKNPPLINAVDYIKRYLMKYLAYSAIALFLLNACTGPKQLAQSSKFDLELLYRSWEVVYIETPKMQIAGQAMGDPIYTFTRDSFRIKSFVTPPHADSVRFFFRNDSLFYQHPTKILPPTAIVELSDSLLILQSEKAEWKLQKPAP